LYHIEFHEHFATPLEYVICNHIYLTLATLYCLKIPLPLIKIKEHRVGYQINQSGIFEWCNVVTVR